MKSLFGLVVAAFETLAISISVSGQIDVPVTKLQSTTADGITIEIGLRGREIKRGQDIVVSYSVHNKGNKTIQFVKSAALPNINVFDLSVISIQSAYIYPNSHRTVDYQFIGLLPGRTHRSTIVIPARVYLEDHKYSFDDAKIQVSFLYFSGKKPDECDDTRYSLPCLSAVSKIGKVLTIGMLALNINP